MKALFALALLVSAPVFADDAAIPPRDDHPNFHRPHMEFVCVSQNLFRQRFVGRDFFIQRARWESLQQCQRSSFRFGHCRLLGCQRVFRR